MIDALTPSWPAAPRSPAPHGSMLRRAFATWLEHWPRVLALALLACAAWPLAGRGALGALGASPAVDGSGGAASKADTALEWPTSLDGEPLRPLALTVVEQRFARRFPGRIGRFAADGGDVWVLRDVVRPTRALHPAADCFRGLGYRIEPALLQREAEAPVQGSLQAQAHTDAPLWRCFVAERNGERLRVCERIVDAQGRGFVDASSWYWAATLGHSSGPWRALTRVEAL
ncbi:MAG: hypothetical protein HS128_22710 [Ideonella sp.]|nr:hypothetical protein [Ideonella sp.]MCC7458391.1 hypothetical protein [Nitrospira sp.]